MNQQANIKAQIDALIKELNKDMRQSVLIELAQQIRATADAATKGNP